MIQIARHEPSKNGSGLSSPGLGSGKCIDKAQKEPSQSVQFIERFVVQRSGFCLGAALSIGIALGWWLKRS
jgi:hypothetical protein